MHLDRTLQRQVLEYLRTLYDADQPPDFADQPFGGHPALWGNLRYLAEHGLLERTVAQFHGHVLGVDYRITAAGLDFLEADGGLGAVLGTVTVRLDADTLRALLEAKVLTSALPEPEKQALVGRLRAFSARALEHLVLKLLDQAVESPAPLLRLLGNVADRCA